MPRRPQNSPTELSAEAKVIAILEKRIQELEKSNARLMRMVEMAMEERFYRPTITGGVRENKLTPAMPADSLNDVTVFDEAADAALVSEQDGNFHALEQELNEIEGEHLDWRSRKGLTNEKTAAAVA